LVTAHRCHRSSVQPTHPAHPLGYPPPRTNAAQYQPYFHLIFFFFRWLGWIGPRSDRSDRRTGLWLWGRTNTERTTGGYIFVCRHLPPPTYLDREGEADDRVCGRRTGRPVRFCLWHLPVPTCPSIPLAERGKAGMGVVGPLPSPLGELGRCCAAVLELGMEAL